ncbi:glycosyltransferase family 4 protein [Zavarzinella formosa]|uniref:glycosyltransferase family 4 protein n=1 Tax=Zavarzinella formosa TaxID=360055 RepID=UPI0002DE9844|nr:glycosyltransferase [Zavarzinella formosa]
MRVLLIAEACNPTWTSVPLVGHNWARALADQPDLQLTIVTHIRNKAGIAQSDLGSKARIEYIDNEFIAAPAYKLAKLLRGGNQLSWTIDTAMAWPSYVVFEKMLAARFGRALQRGEYDLIHRVTPLSPTAVSPLAGRTNVPMIAGPLNGGLPWPKEFPELVRREREWLVPLRNGYKLLPYHRSTYRHLAGVIAASHSTAGEIPRFFHGKRFFHPENGVDPARFPLAAGWTPPKDKFRFVTAGRLVPYKGLGLTLEAIRRSPRLQRAELRVIGDGPDRLQHEEFVRQNNLGECVKFLGQLPQTELAREFRESQAFVFPSLREFGGGVVLEAMASGLPSLIVDYGGPSELIDAHTGIKLPMRTREPLIESLKAAMEKMAESPEACRAMGEAAVATVARLHTWSAKAKQMTGIYREVSG